MVMYGVRVQYSNMLHSRNTVNSEVSNEATLTFQTQLSYCLLGLFYYLIAHSQTLLVSVDLFIGPLQGIQSCHNLVGLNGTHKKTFV